MRRYILTDYCMWLNSVSRPAPRVITEPAPLPTHPTAARVPGIKGGQGHTGRGLELAAYTLGLIGSVGLLSCVTFVGYHLVQTCSTR